MRLKRKPQQEGGAEGSHESATRWCCRHDDLESQVLLPRVAAVAQHWIPNIDLTNCFPDLKPFSGGIQLACVDWHATQRFTSGLSFFS
jgi:hypothetical protein